MSGLIIAAPGSGSGKTTVTLGILRALSQRGVAVRGAKSGPDYIDPMFHSAACGAECVNLDAWAMTPARIRNLAAGPELLIIEGAMGLFDGAPPDGKGAVADLARLLDLPVILVVDASHMAQSVAALVAGFAGHDPRVRVAGVILNKVGSPRHEAMLRNSLTLPVLGVLHRDPALQSPARHLGLVPAGERSDLDNFLDHAGDLVARQIDLTALQNLARPLPDTPEPKPHQPVTRRMAIAQDAAFAFRYPHRLAQMICDGWEIIPFSPLADAPVPQADLIFLPGGYPELHAQTIAANATFLKSLRKASENIDIYGECGGYMVLGESLTDADGVQHEMAGLLALQTSFATRKLHLGYRMLKATHGPYRGRHTGHEFHYSTTIKADGTPLFEAEDAEGNTLPPMGLIEGRVSGSFAHIIDEVLPRPRPTDTAA